MRALHQDARRLVLFVGLRIVGDGRIERDPAGVVASQMLSMIVKPLLGVRRSAAAGGDAPAAQLRCLAFLAAVALRDAVAHVPVVREPNTIPWRLLLTALAAETTTSRHESATIPFRQPSNRQVSTRAPLTLPSVTPNSQQSSTTLSRMMTRSWRRSSPLPRTRIP